MAGKGIGRASIRGARGRRALYEPDVREVAREGLKTQRLLRRDWYQRQALSGRLVERQQPFAAAAEAAAAEHD